MRDIIQNIIDMPFDYLFNMIMVMQWALFMFYTMTPRYSKKLTLLVSLFVSIICPIISLQIPDHTLPRLISTPAIMLAFGFICFKNKPVRTVFCSFFPTLALTLAEMLNILIYPESFLHLDALTGYWARLRFFVLLFYYVPVYGLVLWAVASRISKTRYSLTTKQWVTFLFFPLSQVATLFYIFNSIFGTDFTTMQVIALGALLLLCIAADIALVRTIADAGRKAELEATNRMLEKQLNMQISHYEALTSQYEANRRIRHDIMHHVNTIQYLLADGKQQEAAEYAGQFLKENRRSSMLGSCENPVVDAFLFGRVEEAKKQGIPVKTDIILPAELPISNTELVIVFGNIMDNAVEACAKIDNPSIELDARIEGSYLIISETNPALPEPEDNKKRRIPELERGVGTQILESLAKKHDGSSVIETKDGKFTVSVILRLYK